jgi:hypothetical protein
MQNLHYVCICKYIQICIKTSGREGTFAIVTEQEKNQGLICLFLMAHRLAINILSSHVLEALQP